MEAHERASAQDGCGAHVIFRPSVIERAEAHGRFYVECFGPDGVLKWADTAENVVCTEGKNLMFTAGFVSGYSLVGPYLGLISSVSYTAVQAGDTGAQINGTNGWKEAGGANAPTYSGNRQVCVWAAAAGGAIALSSTLAYNMTGTGTVKGLFILFGSGALATKDDAHGTLWSAGLFSQGDKTVGSGDTINVSYNTSM